MSKVRKFVRLFKLKRCCGKRMMYIPTNRFVETYFVGERDIDRIMIEPSYYYCTVCGRTKYTDALGKRIQLDTIYADATDHMFHIILKNNRFYAHYHDESIDDVEVTEDTDLSGVIPVGHISNKDMMAWKMWR